MGDLIDRFMIHLSHEYSVELLLSFIEFKQFKQLMQSDDEFMNGMSIGMGNTTKAGRLELCDALPQSHIVFEAHSDEPISPCRYLLIARDLFRKYVDYSSEFEIN